MSPNMICKFNSFIEFSHMYSNSMNLPDTTWYSRENNEAIPETFPLANATEIVELDPEDIILPVADDPNDFIIELSNECDDLQYIAEKTNELFNTTYTEEDVNTIINQFIESISEE